MKASIKFRDEQKPLIRATVPLNILGFPFQSGIVAGESKELSLNLCTFFDSGPSLKFSYRPNDSSNPFSFVFKSGIGHFGSPISSSMTMSAQFNLIGNQNPTFFVHFKPQLGDFTLKKSQSSGFPKGLLSKTNGVVTDEEKSVERLETTSPVINNGYFSENGLFPGKKFTNLSSELPDSSVFKGLLSGMEVSARTALPLRKRAVLNFRWGVRLPAEEEGAGSLLMKSNQTGRISMKRFPLLVMNKIGIEHVAPEEKKDDSSEVGKSATGVGNLTEACYDVKRQLELIQFENRMLRKSMDDLKSEVSGGRREMKLSNGDKRSSEVKGFSEKKLEGENEELKKASRGP